MSLKAFAFFTLLFFETFCVTAQVKIGAAGNPHPSSVLELDGGGTKGILIPKVTAVLRGNLPSPAQGLLVYQTDGVTGFYVNRSSIPGAPNWSLLSEGGNFWQNTVLPNNVVNTNSGSVGIGSGNTSLARFMVKGTDGDAQAIFGVEYPGISVESSPPAIAFNNYYKDARKYMASGHAGTLTMDQATGNFIFSNYGTGNAGGIVVTNNTLATLTQTGKLGIGVLPALAGLQVDAKTGAVNALFGSNTSGVAIESGFPGIGFNSYYNAGRKSINTGFGSLMGQDPATGRFYILTSPSSVTGSGTAMPLNDRFVINATGHIGIEGNTDPKAPLSFASNIGNKIALWGDASAPHYGIGMQGSLMQLYASDANADIAFGYGSSAAFTERMRIKGNGNVGIGIAPAAKLHVSGNVIVSGDQQIGGVLKIAGGNPDAGDILTAISNDGTAGWRLPNAGRYAFHVSNNSGAGSLSTLKFNTDNGNLDFIEDFAFNITTQRFTAPADGLYQFNYCVNFSTSDANNTNGIYELVIIRNNGAVDNLVGYFQQGEYGGTLSGSTIVRLNANDFVRLLARSSSGLVKYGASDSGNFFSGYRIK